jgi:hypothetical protein
MFISRMSRAAAEDSFAATRLMHRGSVAHGLLPWLSSVAATRLELVSQVCWHPWIRRGAGHAPGGARRERYVQSR